MIGVKKIVMSIWKNQIGCTVMTGDLFDLQPNDYLINYFK
jgi:hypothetical protein